MINGGKNMLLAGVGGQGILLASEIICKVMMTAGYDVKKSEVHGMAQRGGSVTSHVRYGKKVFSPIARKGDIDILISFEKLETLRYLDYLKSNGMVIINDAELYPPSVNLGDATYPEDIPETVRKYFEIVKIVNASDIAVRAGNIRTVNTAILGVLSAYLDTIEAGIWESVIRTSFPEKVIKENIAAFNLGRKA
ncbi:MAG: indolepyruvate oxidoreductase subunit beta [Syntrophales bacterium]|nr:indolepyruvate oxidoreductase subunit beta [Syntrophales bacterium]